MRARLSQALLWFVPTVIAGVALAAIEAIVVAVTRPELFLSVREFARYWLIVTCVSISLLLIIASLSAFVSLLLQRYARERYSVAVALATGVLAAPLSAWLFWELTQGRRLRGLSYRPLAVSGAALLASLLLMLAMLGLLRVARAGKLARKLSSAALWALAASCLVADARVLHRLYPALHWMLSALALLLAAGAARLWPFAAPRSLRAAHGILALGLLAALAGPFLLRGVRDAPNLRFAVAEAAPLTGKLLGLVRKRSLSTLSTLSTRHSRGSNKAVVSLPSAPGSQASGTHPAGISLRGEDILIVTIDALRADRLRVYGAHQDITPELDHLAEGAAVFTHAYTPTPHTSYAIGSLWTGKYLRPVLSLPAAQHSHPTLPNLMRRFGYRTAAFYPPAVFFVDEERFEGLAEDHFGFEYVKEMFAPAHDRVAQLQEYLDEVDPGHPLLVWVHLFEPHEPYAPPPEFARGSEPEQRYDGEVATADAATGALIATFRKRRPNATVIVTSDHGEEFGEHGGQRHGTTLFEEQVRVPLLWSSPGRVQPRRISSPAQLIDIAPTLLSALSIPRDPRMRGADLSALLNGAPEQPELRAFASIEELQMLTDGTDKLICEASEGSCRLYDLVSDPSESRDASGTKPEVAAKLSAELSSLVASIPEGEVLAMQSGDAWPKALARARLGDRAAREELLPLLGDPRPAVRAEALRALAHAHSLGALSTVESLADHDEEPEVREEAALTAFTFGAQQYEPRIRALLKLSAEPTPSELDIARRAAFALLPDLGRDGERVLFDLAADGGAGLAERERALSGLGQSRAANGVARLTPLLAEVRLRPAVARALGELRDPAAVEVLMHALAKERYPEARAAEVEALVTLHAKRVLPRIVRLLGTETGLPGGLLQWAKLSGAARVPGGLLLDLRRGSPPNVVRGEWFCRKRSEPLPGCRPVSQRAELRLPKRLLAGEGRLVLSVWASGGSDWLRIAGREVDLHRGRNDVSLPLARNALQAPLAVSASAGAFIELIGFVNRSADIPPPPPDPYLADSAPQR